MDYMVALKQEFLNTLHSSPFYFDDSKTQADVERYTDKLRKNQEKPWEPSKKKQTNKFLCLNYFKLIISKFFLFFRLMSGKGIKNLFKKIIYAVF